MTPLSLLSVLWQSQAHWWDTSSFLLSFCFSLSFSCFFFFVYLRCFFVCVSVLYYYISSPLPRASFFVVVLFSAFVLCLLTPLLVVNPISYLCSFLFLFSLSFRLLLIKKAVFFFAILSCVYPFFFLLDSLTLRLFFSLLCLKQREQWTWCLCKLCRIPLGWSVTNTSSYFCRCCSHIGSESIRGSCYFWATSYLVIQAALFVLCAFKTVSEH